VSFCDERCYNSGFSFIADLFGIHRLLKASIVFNNYRNITFD